MNPLFSGVAALPGRNSTINTASLSLRLSSSRRVTDQRHILRKSIEICCMRESGIKRDLTAIYLKKLQDSHVFSLKQFALAIASRESEQVTNLSIAGYSLDSTLVRAFTQLLIRNQHLEELDLRCTQLNDEGMVYLAQVLEKNRSLEKIWLGGNNITALGAKELAEVIMSGQCTPSLLAIDLSNNNIGDVGAIALANAVVSGKCPQQFVGFDLRNNGLRDLAFFTQINALNAPQCPSSFQGFDPGVLRGDFNLLSRPLPSHIAMLEGPLNKMNSSLEGRLWQAYQNRYHGRPSC